MNKLVGVFMAFQMFVFVLGVFCFFLCPNLNTASFQYPRNTSYVENVDSLIDEVMPNITRHIHNWSLDPFYLGDLGTLDLSNCWVNGLSSVYRAGSWHVTYLGLENVAIVQAVIGFQHLGGSCRFRKRILFYTHQGTIAMRMQSVTTSLLIHQTMNRDANPNLRQLDVEIPGDVQLEARGSGALSFVLDTLKVLYRRRMKHLVRDKLQHRFRDLLAKYFGHVTFGNVEQALHQRNYSILLNSSWVE